MIYKSFMLINRPSTLFPLFADTTTLPGIGPKTAMLLSRKIGQTVLDLVFHIPISIIDRRPTIDLKSCPSHSVITVLVNIKKHIPSFFNSKKPYKVLAIYKNIEIEIIFFKPKGNYLLNILPINETVAISGKIVWFNDKIQITHPDYIVNKNKISDIPNFEPVYPLISGISSKILRRAIINGISKIPNNIPEWIPELIIKKYKWPSFKNALINIHVPKENYLSNINSISRDRLSFDEMLANQLANLKIKNSRKINKKTQKILKGKYFKSLISDLKFKLTESQKICILEIFNDQSQKYQMTRMLQGDVGSGKTLVAISSILNTIETGGQVALMAPTDILSRQHYLTICDYFKNFNIRTVLLTKKLKYVEKNKLLDDIKLGLIDLVIGTHSLISKNVEFNNLCLAIIDEQHKFGVEQRNSLLQKGVNVDLLLITATPIPRSLSMTIYGDLDISTINEKPLNRKNIYTIAIPKSRYDEVITAFKRALLNGDKAYWICPLLEETETIDVEAVKTRYNALKKIFDKYNPVLAHGKQTTEERNNSIDYFLTGKSKVLVATTVIEVGVDVPDASIIVIENAERFGLSQLHQLRGRVGRGDKQSYCLLLYNTPINNIAKERLEIIKNSNDGFLISEKDLILRGPGEILGKKQSGENKLKFSTFNDDKLLNLINDNINYNKDFEKKEDFIYLLSIFNKNETVQTMIKY